MAEHLVATYDPQASNIGILIGDGSVSAQANVGAHFSQRTTIYHYPEKVGETDFVILRLESPTRRLLPNDKSTIPTLAHHLMMNTTEYLDSARDLLLGSHYGVVLWHDPWLVMRRDVDNDANVAEVLDKIELLRTEWSRHASK
jgi:hypothetical protein